ncbi:hypothetical protein [Phenylobacterium soli]|nr:hypothetical protein [Phenylobacterium soli]
MKMLNPMIVVGLVVSLAACASEPPRRGGGHGFRRGGPPREGMVPDADGARRSVFISPSGQPFRGADGLRAWFAAADADHDGALTAAEFQADAMAFFQVLDANHDGTVDGFEVSAYEQTIAPEIAAMEFERPDAGGPGFGRRGRGGRRGPPVGPRGRYALINEPEPVAGADENVDGRVTAEEWKHATARRFALLDKARTGRLTLDGLEGRKPPKS